MYVWVKQTVEAGGSQEFKQAIASWEAKKVFDTSRELSVGVILGSDWLKKTIGFRARIWLAP